MKGFVAAAECKGWGYLYLGVSVADGWAKYGPILEEMLDSLQFME
ncbi:MAG: hypothetical protein WBB22_00560 [Anaerolineae bacterium]